MVQALVPPENGYKKKWFRFAEADMQQWFLDNGISYSRIPEHNPACETIFKGQAPAINFPVNGTEYIISRKNAEPLKLLCKTGNDVSKVFWYVNNRFYKSSSPAEKQFFVPDEGPVKISCTDDKGRNRDISINVKYVNL